MAQPDRVLPIDGAPNFRDIGGYVGADGRQVRWGRMFRAGALGGLTVADHTAIAPLGIGWVIDLRTDREVERSPDPDFGAGRIHLPVIDGAIDVEGLTIAVKTGDLGAIPDGLLVTGTARIATEFTSQWSTFMAHLVANPGATTLFHCTGGKDRTGWASAVILRTLGVSADVVFDDYLLSNSCLAASTEKRLASVRSTVAADRGISEADVDLGGLPGLLGVRASYLEAAFDAVDAEYGSFDAYLTDVLGCTADDLGRLRDDLLE